jgi:peptidoglycan endopeptidase LytE
MSTRPLVRASAVAAVLSSLVTGCTSATLGVPPGTILSTVSTVIASIPVSGSGSDTRGSSTRRTRIPASPAATASAARLLRTGEAYLGVKYKWGGNTPAEGFDCSGFTKYVFAKNGISLPRTSREQAGVGTRIPADFAALRPGDLMFFAEPGEAISHVAIYAGDGRILNSSVTTHGVGYLDLNDGGDWFVAYFVAARRVQ